jgi:uncharacterized protein
MVISLSPPYILAELVALLTSPLRIPRPRVIDFITGIKNSPHIQIIHVDSTLDLQAWELLTQRPDNPISRGAWLIAAAS